MTQMETQTQTQGNNAETSLAEALNRNSNPYVWLDISAQQPMLFKARTARLGNYEERTEVIECGNPGEVGPFKDYKDFVARGILKVERKVRVYKVSGHNCEIIVPEDYNLDEVRKLRQSREDLTRANAPQDQLDAINHLVAAQPFGDRILPEDLVSHLDEVPDSRYLGKIFLLDQSNAEELWNRLTYDRNFVSSASVMPNGDIMFYRGKKDVFLRDNVFHEWSHRLEQKYGDLSEHWGYALELENGIAPRPYAFRSYSEHFAVISEELLALDAGRFIKVCEYAPVRVPMWLAGLKKSLEDSLYFRPSCYHTLYMERVRYAQEVLLPRARDYLNGTKQRLTEKLHAAQEAYSLDKSDENAAKVKAAEEKIPLDVAKAAKVLAFLEEWLS